MFQDKVYILRGVYHLVESDDIGVHDALHRIDLLLHFILHLQLPYLGLVQDFHGYLQSVQSLISSHYVIQRVQLELSCHMRESCGHLPFTLP